MTFFAINRWKLTGDEFPLTFSHPTIEIAEAAGRDNADSYTDNVFVRVVEAANWNDVKGQCVVTPLPARRRDRKS